MVVACDLLEFPASKSGNKYLIVFENSYTKWVELKLVRRADRKTLARAFEELILFRWKTPDYYVTDNGKDFDNKTVREALKAYGVKHSHIPPYYAQADPVERCNKTLKTLISIYVREDHREWDVHIHEFRHAVNTATQSSTKVLPAFLNLGRHPRPVKSLRREIEGTGIVERVSPEVWLDRIKRLDVLRNMVAKNVKQAGEKQERLYNRNKRHVEYNVGGEVMRRVHVLSDASKRFNAKLAPKYEGLFTIVEKKSPTVYILDSRERGSKRLAMIFRIRA